MESWGHVAEQETWQKALVGDCKNITRNSRDPSICCLIEEKIPNPGDLNEERMFRTLAQNGTEVLSTCLPPPQHTHGEVTTILKDTFHPVSEQHEENKKSSQSLTTSLLPPGQGWLGCIFVL